MAALAASGVLSTIIVGIILLAVVALVIRHLYKKKKAGIGACGCDCASCGGGCGHMDGDSSKTN